MNAKEFFRTDGCMDNAKYDISGSEDFYFGEEEMVLFAEEYHKAKNNEKKERKIAEEIQNDKFIKKFLWELDRFYAEAKPSVKLKDNEIKVDYGEFEDWIKTIEQSIQCRVEQIKQQYEATK